MASGASHELRDYAVGFGTSSSKYVRNWPIWEENYELLPGVVKFSAAPDPCLEIAGRYRRRIILCNTLSSSCVWLVGLTCDRPGGAEGERG